MEAIAKIENLDIKRYWKIALALILCVAVILVPVYQGFTVHAFALPVIAWVFMFIMSLIVSYGLISANMTHSLQGQATGGTASINTLWQNMSEGGRQFFTQLSQGTVSVVALSMVQAKMAKQYIMDAWDKTYKKLSYSDQTTLYSDIDSTSIPDVGTHQVTSNWTATETNQYNINPAVQFSTSASQSTTAQISVAPSMNWSVTKYYSTNQLFRDTWTSVANGSYVQSYSQWYSYAYNGNLALCTPILTSANGYPEYYIPIIDTSTFVVQKAIKDMSQANNMIAIYTKDGFLQQTATYNPATKHFDGYDSLNDYQSISNYLYQTFTLGNTILAIQLGIADRSKIEDTFVVKSQTWDYSGDVNDVKNPDYNTLMGGQYAVSENVTVNQQLQQLINTLTNEVTALRQDVVSFTKAVSLENTPSYVQESNASQASGPSTPFIYIPPLFSIPTGSDADSAMGETASNITKAMSENHDFVLAQTNILQALPSEIMTPLIIAIVVAIIAGAVIVILM